MWGTISSSDELTGDFDSRQSGMAACFVFWREINFVHSARHRNLKFNLMVSADYEPT